RGAHEDAPVAEVMGEGAALGGLLRRFGLGLGLAVRRLGLPVRRFGLGLAVRFGLGLGLAVRRFGLGLAVRRLGLAVRRLAGVFINVGALDRLERRRVRAGAW